MTRKALCWKSHRDSLDSSKKDEVHHNKEETFQQRLLDVGKLGLINDKRKEMEIYQAMAVERAVKRSRSEEMELSGIGGASASEVL